MARQIGWRFLEREGREEDRRLQSRSPQASGEFQHHRHGARIVICTWRARDRIVMSAQHVIGGGADVSWSRSEDLWVRRLLVAGA